MPSDHTIVLSSGRVVETEEGAAGEIVRVRGATGQVEITIELTAGGPRLVVAAADLELRAARSVTVACQDFALEATGRVDVRGADVSVTATRGDLALDAHDVVDIDGEKILLNSDKAREPPAWMRERLGARLASEIPRTPRRDVEGALSLSGMGASGDAEEPSAE